MEFYDYVWLEVIKTGLVCLTLGFGWFVGQRIISYWDIKKKRQELDIATAREFHRLYGEFKEVSRLWRGFCFTGKKVAYPQTLPMELLRRAAAAEGGIEAIIVKLATERILETEDIKTLGLFRQAYQKLREAIRDDKCLEWTHGTPEYELYNDLASKSACIIVSNGTRRRSQPAESSAVLKEITDIRPGAWEDQLQRIRQQEAREMP
jgi:hypothetical protein